MRTVAAASLLSLVFTNIAFAQETGEAKEKPRKIEDFENGPKPKPRRAPPADDPDRECPLKNLVQTGGCEPSRNRPEDSSTNVLLKLSENHRLSLSSVGTGQGFSLEIVNEAVQILGQIVVDRASQEAFRQLQERLVTLLDCKGDGAKDLPLTCEALQSLRLQDIAMAPQALSSALTADVAAKLLARAFENMPGAAAAATAASEERAAFATAAVAKVQATAAKTFAVKNANGANTDAAAKAEAASVAAAAAWVTAAEKAKTAREAIANLTTWRVLGVMQRDLAPLLFRADHGIDVRMATLALNHLLTEGERIVREKTKNAADALCNATNDPDRANAALGFAAAATTACLVSTEGNGDCHDSRIVSALFARVCGTTGDPTIESAAETLAVDLITVATALTDKGKPDVKRRLLAANDGLFDFLCLSVDFGNGCPASAMPPTGQGTLGALHAIFASAIEGDKLETVVRTATLLRAIIPNEEVKDQRRRALRLLAGLLDYTVTFEPAAPVPGASTPPQTAADLHDKRTKILESLTAEMTDRTGRLGDNIFSVGGALRATGGLWIGSNEVAFYGPLSLPLGFALDCYDENRARGWHFELVAIDLGQYLTFDDGGNVREVEAVAAFAPGIGVARFWGTGLPFTVGLNATYSPSYQFNPGGTKGGFSLSAAAGFYVPLLDFN